MRKLYASNGTPFGRQVRILLGEKGLDYEQDPVGAQQRPVADHAALNPGLKVPVLVDDGLTLFDSRLILEYLLATYPGVPPDAPAPPLAGAMVRPGRRWEDGKVLVTLGTLLDSAVNLRQLERSGVPAAQSDYLRRQQTRVETCLDWLDGQATAEGFVPGTFTVADIMAICALGFLHHFAGAGGEAWGRFPWQGRRTLEALARRFADRPSVAGTRPG